MIKYRPSKLNEELIDKMYDVIKEGLPIHYACDLCCITQPCHQNWMKTGEENISSGNYDTLHAAYFIAIKNAQAEYVKEANQDIKSGRPGWQGAAWWLERTRQDFMPKQEISAGADGKVTVVLGGKIKDIKQNTLTESDNK